MARLAFSPNASQPRPAVVLPSPSGQEPFPVPLPSLPGLGDTSPSSFGLQPAQPGALHGDGACPLLTDPMGSLQRTDSVCYSPFPELAVYLCACTAKDVPVQGREKGESALWLGDT